MSEVFKLQRFKLDKNGERIPRLDKHGRGVLVKHGPEAGGPAYEKEYYKDAKGQPRFRARVYDPVTRKYKVKTFRRQGSRTSSRAGDGTAWGWVKQMEVRREHHQPLQGDQRAVAEYIEWWIDAKARGDEVVGRRGDILEPPRYRTVTLYRKMIGRWITNPPEGLPPLGGVRMDQLTHGHLDNFYRAMRSATTVGVVRRLHAMLGQAFAEAVRKGILFVNPCDAATAPRKPKIDESAKGRGTNRVEEEDGDATSRSLTEGQAARFLASARELEREGPYSALWHLLTLAGLRPTEAFALDWKDLDLDGPEPKVRVRRSLVLRRRTKEQREQNEAAGWHFEPPKTKNGYRDVPLPALATKELRSWKLRQEWHRRVSGDEWTEYGLVFTTGKGTPLGSNNRGYRGSFVRLMAHAHREEGEDGALGAWGPEPVRKHLTGPLPARRFTPSFRVYDLRHTYVTLSLAAGVPPHVVSKLAGHATVNFTLTRYAKALPSQKQEAAAMMDRMFGTSA